MDGARRPQRDLVVAFGGDFQAMSDEPPHRVPIEAELDLHTFAPRDIRSVVTEYVHAASAAGLQEVRFVHGRGTGVQRGNVQSTLEQHPLVTAFWDDPRSHLGATIASIRPGAPDST
ncbi:MAG: Smr/MutS family protein [Acidobacteria bacterium]|nr:Smr/MutS family protein [Acidobacteriota bacterium]